MRMRATDECMKEGKAALRAAMECELVLPEFTLARERRIVADAQMERAREGKLGIDAMTVPAVQ